MNVLLSLAFAAMAKPPGAASWNAEALVAKNLEARGGAEALGAIHSLRLTGKMLVGGGQKIDWVETLNRPDQIREDLTIGGMTQTWAWDGKESWTINPFQGRREPERVPAEDAKGLVEDAPIGGALQYAKEQGWPIRYLGTDDIEGTLAHELEVQRPGGDVMLVWLDPDYFLQIRTLSRRTEHGVLVEAQEDFGDYEKVGSVWFPFLIEMGPKGGSSDDRTKAQVEKAEANVAVDAALFAFPAPPAGK
jgi:hypothetical protein